MTNIVSMTSKSLIIPIIFLTVIISCFDCFADNPYCHSVGASFSPKMCGISWEFYSKNESAFHQLFLGSDLYGVIDGRYPPGYRIEYFLNYDFKTWRGRDGLKINFYAGPGAAAGLVRDVENGRGFFTGLCGDIGLSFGFRSYFKINVGFSGALAYHVARRKGHNYSVNLYKNGILTVFYPVVGIRYVFK